MFWIIWNELYWRHRTCVAEGFIKSLIIMNPSPFVISHHSKRWMSNTLQFKTPFQVRFQSWLTPIVIRFPAQLPTKLEECPQPSPCASSISTKPCFSSISLLNNFLWCLSQTKLIAGCKYCFGARNTFSLHSSSFWILSVLLLVDNQYTE